MIVDYNKHMLGVDKLDQMISYYSFLHKTIKWWRKVFFWILEVATMNAYILYEVLVEKRGERLMSQPPGFQTAVDFVGQSPSYPQSSSWSLSF